MKGRPDTGVIEELTIDRASLLAGLLRLKGAAWELADKAEGLSVMPPTQRAAAKDAITAAAVALREVRGALQVEASMLPPMKGGSAGEQDFDVLLTAEVRANPKLAQMLVSALAPSDRRALLESATIDAEVLTADNERGK
jgi:hypothetical protein